MDQRVQIYAGGIGPVRKGERVALPETADEVPLYAPRRRIYSRAVDGRFRRIKWVALLTILGVYYFLPWLRWDRGPDAPDQALLLDMTGRRAYFFGFEIWPQEIYYLVGLLVIGAVGLFLVTALAGRVWCGFVCPQTIWTDLFLWVERQVEGDRNERMRRDSGPLTAGAVARKTAKHALWLLIALATGGMWICYYNDASTVTRAFFTGEATTTVYFMTGLFTATTYLLAGWAREQVCIYMCPWPRFQAAMFDEHSLIVTYEDWRGEPRGKVKHGEDFAARGHCVDCTMCVQVCPTGVDIRNGQQLACIGCGLCIDACNSIMAKVGLPGNLIAYDSVANQVARTHGQPTVRKPVRTRTVLYAAFLVLVVAVMAFAVAGRARTEINVLADRAPMFVVLSDGGIRNGYTYKVLNMERAPKIYELAIDGLPGATLTVIGEAAEDVERAALPVGPDQVGTFRVLVRLPRARIAERTREFDFVIRDPARRETIAHRAVFNGPAR